ncbi:MAG: pyrroline-5-carboxylate reductase [Clostridia bacterium]|nr:pyrroline-5-carboxylate reductase [Clostridia bacterium]
MKNLYRLGVIGCGFMAESILKGVVLSDYIHEKKIIVSDVNGESLDRVNYLGVHTTLDNRFVAENSDYLLLAVKPQNFADVAASLNGFVPEKVISIMAGVKKNTIKNGFGYGAIKVARCMPNLPCSIGTGALGVDITDYARNVDDVQFIMGIFNSLGHCVNVDESKLDAVTGISGSGPAYVFLFIDAMIDAGIHAGLSRDEATVLTVQTFKGAAEMVERNETPLPELIQRVCSKGGTTIEAVKVFQENDIYGTIDKAVEACVARSRELSK